MNRTITDAGVAGLPIHEGRAELLEEIMATTPLETDRPQSAPDRPRRALPILAAAAAVLAVIGVVGGATWLGQQRQDGQAGQPFAAQESGEVAVLDAEGWTLTHALAGKREGEVSYRSEDDAELEINWRPADSYDGYVTDRNDIGPATSVTVLGEPALLWAYSRDDHTVIRDVVGDHLLEIRGTGLPRRAYLDLLDRLTPLGTDGLAAHLPAEAFTEAGYAAPGSDLPPVPERPAVIRAPGWSLGLEGDQYFYERGRARIFLVPVGGVADPFAYDRYQDADVRKEVTVLGERSLLAEWKEGGVQYRVVAVPATPTETMIFEATGLSRSELLDALRGAEWVTAAEYEEARRE